MDNFHIGTSGFSYPHWKGIFYPEDLPSKKYFEYYIKYFNDLELNSTFYHLPRESTIEGWYNRSPKNFIFAVKASRFITHIKKLSDPKESLERFLNLVSGLKEKLGPLLFQFPPSLKVNQEKLKRCLNLIPKKYKTSWEFRHQSWFCEEVYEILKKFNAALCLADTPRFPYEEILTADFVYIRLHGNEKLYGSNYSEEELKEWTKKIKRWIKKGFLVYTYFDNDAQGYAVKNAMRLKEILVGCHSEFNSES